MGDVKWIKIFIDIFSNRKFKMIEAMTNGDSIIVIWFKLLCLAGELNEGGLITFDKDKPYTPEMLAIQFNKKLDVVLEALKVLEEFKMIEIDNGFIWVKNWEKYQSLDKLEQAKLKNRERQKLYYYRQKEKQKLLENKNLTLDLTQPNALEEDKEIENKKEEKELDIDSSRLKATTTPTLEEIENYIKEKNYKVNAKKFFDVNEARGWKIANNEIKNWRYLLAIWDAKEVKGDITLEDWQIEGMNDIMEGFKNENN